MKKHLFLTLLFLILSPLSAWSDACDKDEILRLMAERSYINLDDTSFCVDFQNFPNIRVKMAEGSYDLNGQRTLNDKLKSQDQSIKNIVNLLNSSETLADNQKFTIQTKGFADGTFNSTTDNDAAILAELSDNGVISPDKIEKVIKSKDVEGGKAILEEIAKINQALKKPDNAGIKYSDIKDDSRLKSMIRNSYLARSRGDTLCKDISGSSSACDSIGEISPDLDSGKHCFDGCCDQRRGAIVDIQAPQKQIMSYGGTGKYKPPFKSPSRIYQGKLQMAASMSVFDLPLKDDPTLENEVLNKKMFDENYEKDHKRFKDALAGSGCENNAFAIDSVRRMYWTVKGMKETVSPELYQAVIKNDFKKAYELYEKATTDKNQNDLNLFSALFSGSSTSVAVTSRTNCPRASIKNESWGEDDRALRVGKSPYAKCLVKSDSDLLKDKNIADINKMIQFDKKEKPSVFVLQDSIDRSKFTLYDREKNTSATFTFDQKSEHCQNLGVNRNYKVNPKLVKDLKYTPACLQAITHSNFKLPNDFYPQAPIIDGIVPSDPFNCLSVAKAVDHEMMDQNPKGEAIISKEAESAQKPFCKVQANNSLSMTINPQDLTSVGGEANGKQGFMCTGCSSGLNYNKNSKKFDYIPRQVSKGVNGKPGTQRDMASKSWSESYSKVKERPLTMANIKHLRSYVIPNCGTSCEDACACLRNGGIEKKITAPGVNVIDFTDLNEGTSKLVGSYTGDTAGSFACIYTPPVPHTCSYNPLGATSDEDHSLAHEEEICPIAEKLKALPTTSKVAVTPDMIKKYKSNCSQLSFPSTQDQCSSINGGVMCKKKRVANSCAEPKARVGVGAKKAKGE